MNDQAPTNLLHQRRVVIGCQLLVLGLILIGIFGSLITSSTENNQNNHNLASLNEAFGTDNNTLNDVTLSAEAAYVYDVKNKKVIYAKNEDKVLPLASITKLMTAQVVYQLINEQESAVITQSALLQDGQSGFSEGEIFTIETLNELSLISSSNDAAFALADAVGAKLGDNNAAGQFVVAMNLLAEELELSTLNFKNPTGLDISPSEPGAVGSARDVSLLLAHIVNQSPELVESTQRYQARLYNQEGGYHDVENTNEVIYAIPNLLASKTGYTDLAGGNLTIAYDAGFNRPIIITVLGSTRTGRFTDVLTLIELTNTVLTEYE